MTSSESLGVCWQYGSVSRSSGLRSGASPSKITVPLIEPVAAAGGAGGGLGACARAGAGAPSAAPTRTARGRRGMRTFRRRRGADVHCSWKPALCSGAVGELPVQPGAMSAVPPALRFRVNEVLGLLPAEGAPLDGVAAERLARLMEDGEPYLGVDPALAEVGAWMIGARQAPELRRRGCRWLAMFPSAEAARRLAAIALDKGAPPPVRDQAIASL